LDRKAALAQSAWAKWGVHRPAPAIKPQESPAWARHSLARGEAVPQRHLPPGERWEWVCTACQAPVVLIYPYELPAFDLLPDGTARRHPCQFLLPIERGDL
jgi:hypothetical protein